MYEAFFGLSAQPFQLNPDPDFFFASKGHKRALAYLQYGLHKGEGFIVVTGDVGAGKTTLLQGLLRQLSKPSIVAAHIVSTQLEADDLLKVVAAGFGLATGGHDKSDLLVRLQAHLNALSEQGRRALLIVDEAQNLSPGAIEELRMLSNFQVGNRSLVQSFLVGQPEFREVMQRPEMRQLKQRIIASYHLGPLDRGDTERYVEHRLRHVGWKGDPAIDEAAYDRIFAATGGVPRRINALCDRILLAAYLGEQHRVAARDVELVADEIADELGTAGTGDPGGGATASAGAARRAPAAFHDASQSGAIDDRLGDLDRRLKLLESSNGAMFAMLSKVLQGLRVDADRDGAG